MDTSRMPLACWAPRSPPLALRARDGAAPPRSTPLKPCYVSVDAATPARADHREALDLSGSGFTPTRSSTSASTAQPSTARVAGRRAPATSRAASCRRPTRRRASGTFTLRLTERGNPANTVALPSRTTALTLELKPQAGQAVEQRVRFRGRGFTAPTAGLRALRLQGQGRARRSGSAQPTRRPAGTFSVKRQQFPFRAPEARHAGRLQFDQQRSYNPSAATACNVRRGHPTSQRVLHDRADRLRRVRRSAARRRRRRRATWSPAAKSPLQQAERQRVDQALAGSPA